MLIKLQWFIRRHTTDISSVSSTKKIFLLKYFLPKTVNLVILGERKSYGGDVHPGGEKYLSGKHSGRGIFVEERYSVGESLTWTGEMSVILGEINYFMGNIFWRMVQKICQLYATVDLD